MKLDRNLAFAGKLAYKVSALMVYPYVLTHSPGSFTLGRLRDPRGSQAFQGESENVENRAAAKLLQG